VTVTIGHTLRGTPGHIIYAGIALERTYLGTLDEDDRVSFVAPGSAAAYDLYVAVAHVYTEAEMVQTVANGEADLLKVGTLVVHAP
jgi:hypothetical protein